MTSNIKQARAWEMEKLITKQYMGGVANFFGYTGPILATGVAFGVYSYGALPRPILAPLCRSLTRLRPQ